MSDGLTRLTTDKAAFSYTYDSGDATKSFGYDFVRISDSAYLNTVDNVTVTVTENTAPMERKYIITLTNLDKTEDKTRTAELTHSGATPYVTPSSATNSIKGNDLSTSITVNVAANCEWEVDFAAGSEYAEFDTDTFGSGNGSVAIHMNAVNYNTNAATGRSVTLRFTNKYNGITTDYTITQRGVYTSANVNSNTLNGNGQYLSASQSETGRSITFSGSGQSKHQTVNPHYYIGDGTFTASGDGDDFCSFQRLTLNYFDGILSYEGNCSFTSSPSGVGSVNNTSSNRSSWDMASTINSSNAVKNVVLSVANRSGSTGWHVVSLTASYYYWN